jgi:hypothetical protein
VPRFVLSLAILPFFLTAGAFAPAAAESFSVFAKSKESTKVFTFVAYDTDCSPLSTKVEFLTRPANGTASTKRGTYRFSPYDRGKGVSLRCQNRAMPGVALYYKAKPGFRGRDRFRMRVRFGERAPAEADFTVVVQ